MHRYTQCPELPVVHAGRFRSAKAHRIQNHQSHELGGQRCSGNYQARRVPDARPARNDDHHSRPAGHTASRPVGFGPQCSGRPPTARRIERPDAVPPTRRPGQRRHLGRTLLPGRFETQGDAHDLHLPRRKHPRLEQARHPRQHRQLLPPHHAFLGDRRGGLEDLVRQQRRCLRQTQTAVGIPGSLRRKRRRLRHCEHQSRLRIGHSGGSPVVRSQRHLPVREPRQTGLDLDAAQNPDQTETRPRVAVERRTDFRHPLCV